MKFDPPSFQPRPRSWLGILGVLITLSAPLVQALLIPWFKNTFAVPLDRFVSLWVFRIAVLLTLGIARFTEGYPLATFGFQWSQKTLRTRLIEWILTTLAALVIDSVIIFFSNDGCLYCLASPGMGLDSCGDGGASCQRDAHILLFMAAQPGT